MRRITLLFAFAFVVLCFSCNKIHDYLPLPSLPPYPQFNKLYGGLGYDIARSVIKSFDGGYIIASSTNSDNGDVSGNHGGFDAWILKLDKSGKLQWQKALGGSSYDEADAITITLDGGYIIAGRTASNDGDVSGFHGGEEDAWVVKLDCNGNKVWQKTLGGSGNDEAHAITNTLDGGYIIAGETNSYDGDVSGNHGGSGDAWVVKLDKNGNLQWQKSLGGSGYDGAYAIATTLDGGYVMAGFAGSNDGDVSGNHGGYRDAWVVKLDCNGNKLWQKALGGSRLDGALSIIATLDGGYVLAGTTNSNDGDVSGYHGGVAEDSDAWVVKLDKDGNRQWQKPLGGSKLDDAYSITNTLDGGYVMAGSTYSNDGDVSGNHGDSDAWMVKLSKNGKLQWQKTLGGSSFDVGTSVITRLDGSYVMSGITDSNDGDVSGNHGRSDVWITTIKDK